MRINDSIFLGAIVPELDNGTLVIQQNKRILFLSLLSRLIEVVVRGVPPLSLPDAIADSLSYVKAFGGTEQRNLPDGYIERQFIYMMDGSYLLTDIVPTYDGRIEMDFQTTSILGNAETYLSAGSSNFRFAHVSAKTFRVNMWGGTYDSTTTTTNNTRYKFTYNNLVATLESGGSTVFTNTFTDTGTTSSHLIINGLSSFGGVSQNDEGIYLYSFKMWNAQGELIMNLVPAVQRGTVPVVGFYDTVSKTFKTATSGTFAAGGEAVPTPDTPMDIISNNGVVKARHESGLPLGYTLLDYIESTGTQYIDTGITSTINAKAEVKFAPVATNITGYWGARSDPYRFGCTTFSNGTQFGVGMTNNTWPANRTTVVLDDIYDCVVANGYASINGTEYTETQVTTFAVTRTFCLGALYSGGSTFFSQARYYKCKLWENDSLVFNGIPAKRNSDDVLGMYDLISGQFFTNQGTGDFIAGTAVSDPVEIYTDGTVETIEDTIGNTATAEMLLKVGDYQDVQEILAGDVTRKVVVKVLDGTESWETTAQSTVYRWLSPVLFGLPNICICSHYVGVESSLGIVSMPDMSAKTGSSTASYLYIKDSSYSNNLSGFKQYLADQYAAGTPVIVVYPLATETTESVTGQTLQVQAGDNIVEITQASLDNLELEAKYQAAVSLTIQEVQDANLDPNVQVTIN